MEKFKENYPMKRPRSFRKELLSRIPSFISRRPSLPNGCTYDKRLHKKAPTQEPDHNKQTDRKISTCPKVDTQEYRVVLFGGGGVGKSALVWRFLRNTFNEKYTRTIEDTYTHVISCGRNVCTLLINDTSGTHDFPAMRSLSIRRGNAFLLVYSVASRKSFEKINFIYQQMLKERGPLTDVPIYLVGNKTDLVDEKPDMREVASEEGRETSARWGCGFIETSARDNRNVDQLFRRLLAMETARSLSLESSGAAKRVGTCAVS